VRTVKHNGNMFLSAVSEKAMARTGFLMYESRKMARKVDGPLRLSAHMKYENQAILSFRLDQALGLETDM
jgi:hypothetical protein